MSDAHRTARPPGWDILALDNLKRRGSDLNLPRLLEADRRLLAVAGGR